jgi:hypothetical protein
LYYFEGYVNLDELGCAKKRGRVFPYYTPKTVMLLYEDILGPYWRTQITGVYEMATQSKTEMAMSSRLICLPAFFFFKATPFASVFCRFKMKMPLFVVLTPIVHKKKEGGVILT